MARSDGADRDASEPLSRLLARSEAVSRELERARDQLAELQERFDAEEPLTLNDALPAAESPAVETPAAGGSPAGDVADPDPHRGWVVRLPEAADDRDDDAPEPADEPADEPSVEAEITLLQEAARRRLSDER